MKVRSTLRRDAGCDAATSDLGFSLPSEIGRHLIKHGDAVKDIAFQVEDCDFLVKVTVGTITNIQLHKVEANFPTLMQPKYCKLGLIPLMSCLKF